MPEFYVSVDVESNGPIPGPNSMLSLGAVALSAEEEILGKFSVNFEELEGSSGDPDTMAWWAKQPKEVWEACRVDAKSPIIGMTEFVSWVEGLAKTCGSPVCVAYPAGFDFLFVYWYLIRFVGRSPFGISCWDIKTQASVVLKKPFRQTTKRNMPKEWFNGLPPHEHIACSDALEQGLLFLRILKHVHT